MGNESNKEDFRQKPTIPVDDLPSERPTNVMQEHETVISQDAQTQPDRDHAAYIENKIREIQEEEEVPAKKTDPLIGRTIAGRFAVLSRIGAGGMGAVYRAQQIGMDRHAAIKVLLQEFTSDERILKRFQLEALAVSRLTHPNTIRIYDFGKEENLGLYIAMEYLDGKSLYSVLRDEGQLSVARSLKIARQICYSLREAHEKQIIHRDLKPDNIFLLRMPNEPDFVKVLDFGLAKLKEADKTKGTLTQAGMIFGTPKYMSPEQCRSSVIDPRSDIYSLGIILYEMLLGRAPFDGETPLSILLQHIQDMPKDFISVRSDLDIPAPVEELVFKALQKEPDKRFLSISEIEQEIASLEKQYESHYTTVIFCREGLRHKAGLDRSESATVMQTQMAEDLAVLKKARLKKVLVYSTVTVWIVLILTILSIFYFFSFNFLLLSSVRTKGIHFAYFPEYCFRKYRTCCY